MTQNLLETSNTYLLNATAQDTTNSYAKAATKNYADAYTKSGKSFNDLLANANDRLSTASSNYMTRDNRNTVSDRNTRDFNNNNNNRNDNKNSLDRNVSRDTNNVAQNSQTNRQDRLKDSRDNSRNVNDNNSVNSQTSTDDLKNSSSTKEANTTDNENTVSFEDSNSLDKAAVVEVAGDELTAEDMDALNQMLLDDLSTETETAETDVYINAYYQSTLDSLNTVDETVVAEVAVEEPTDLNTLAEVDVSTETTLKDALNELNAGVNAEETSKTTTDTKTQNVETKNGLKDNALKSDVLAKSDENGKVTAEKDIQQDIIDDNKKVEVDIKTDETSIADDDVMVNATDDVVEQFKPVKAENQEGNKTSFREVMEKAGLDEAKLEALNMTVTSNNSSGTDLSNGFQSSAQDDIAKMAINGLNGKKDASEMHTGKDFSKLVDTKNMQQEEAKEISKNDILAQINNKMQAKNINGQQRITLQLTPESLGKITIELSKGKDGLQAKMLTDNVQVKDMLEKNIDGLKSTLASQGVSVNNVSVKVASASETASEFDFGRENFNQEQTQQDFAGTGERGGERGSQFANGNAPENAMNDLEMPTEGIETDMAMEDSLELNPEAEKVAVGVGNVDIEV